MAKHTLAPKQDFIVIEGLFVSSEKGLADICAKRVTNESTASGHAEFESESGFAILVPHLALMDPNVVAAHLREVADHIELIQAELQLEAALASSAPR